MSDPNNFGRSEERYDQSQEDSSADAQSVGATIYYEAQPPLGPPDADDVDPMGALTDYQNALNARTKES